MNIEKLRINAIKCNEFIENYKDKLSKYILFYNNNNYYHFDNLHQVNFKIKELSKKGLNTDDYIVKEIGKEFVNCLFKDIR
jgi:hypothetical protein